MVRPWSDWSECYTTKGCGYGKTMVRLVRMYTTHGCGYGKTKGHYWSECYTTKVCGCGYGKTNGQTGQNVILLKVVVMVRPDWSECYITKGCGYGKTMVNWFRMLYY